MLAKLNRLLFFFCWCVCGLGFAPIVDALDHNIVFFITDDESPTLGCYGDPIAQTPNIDALAADGIRFTNAFATTASCSASRSVVLSGLHNHKNGQYGHQHHFHKFASYENVVSLSLPRALARAGYRTAQIGKYHVAPEQVYHFETYLKGNSRNPVQMAEACRELINADDDRPFFLYFATSDPHRGGGKDKNSKQRLKPDLFGNAPNRADKKGGMAEVFYEPNTVPVPKFLPDTIETREELAQYYQSCSRVDQGLGRLIQILKAAGQYEKTLIVFTSDHGMAFAGGKTTVYEPGLKVPFVVRNPYVESRGVVSKSLISHVDIAPTLLDFAGALDSKTNGPRDWIEPSELLSKPSKTGPKDNRSGGNEFRSYQGKSWLKVLEDPTWQSRDTVFASHTFHEIQMYYPMRVVRDEKYKLIWNIAHPLDYPFASDLWAASSWQAQWQKGKDAPYGSKSVNDYLQRAEFELFDIQADPHETNNLANDPAYRALLETYQAKLKQLQKQLDDPWRVKWKYE